MKFQVSIYTHSTFYLPLSTVGRSALRSCCSIHLFGCLQIIINMAGGTGYSNIELSIRRVIVKEIEKRNYREKEPFEVLIATCKFFPSLIYFFIVLIFCPSTWKKNFVSFQISTFNILDNKLFDAVSELRHEILLLTIQNEKLKQESLQLQNGPSEGKAPEKSSVIIDYAIV